MQQPQQSEFSHQQNGFEFSNPMPVYLDYNATTPLDPRVLEEMMPYLTTFFGNAASVGHVHGDIAREAVEQARTLIAESIGARPGEIVFTSGATESDNLAIAGTMLLPQFRNKTVVTVKSEHKAVLDTCEHLESFGIKTRYVETGPDGRIDFDSLQRLLDENTGLVTVMHANNEIGTIQELDRIGALCRKAGVRFHTDSTQSIGKLPFNVSQYGVSLASLTGHKIYGPKGIGALYVREGTDLACLIHGGGHEHGLRSGTLNVPGIVGLASALRFAIAELKEHSNHCSALRNRLFELLLHYAPETIVNGPDPRTDPQNRLPNNLNVSIPGDAGELVVAALQGRVAYSSRSACSSGNTSTSHVLKAVCQRDGNQAHLRFGVGRFTTAEEIEFVGDCLNEYLG